MLMSLVRCVCHELVAARFVVSETLVHSLSIYVNKKQKIVLFVEANKEGEICLPSLWLVL